MNIESDILMLAGTAAGVGFIHTLAGPDHYIPFIVIARARRWGLRKTLILTLLCGVGHVLSSIILGAVGFMAGIALFRLEAFEAFRGSAAAWLLIAFGLAYFVWGLHLAWRNKPHRHLHSHSGDDHDHIHVHEGEHSHPHERGEGINLTPWILFIIFIFGPCEPLIPLVVYAAAKHNAAAAGLVSLAFSLPTILTMLVIVAASSWGIGLVNLGRLEKYTHAIAGSMIFLCGLGVELLGL